MEVLCVLSVTACGGNKGALDSLGLKLSAGSWTRVFCSISTCSLPLRHLFSPFMVLLMEILSLTMLRTWSWSLMLYFGTKDLLRRKIMHTFCEQAHNSPWVYNVPTELKSFVHKRVMGANTRRKFWVMMPELLSKVLTIQADEKKRQIILTDRYIWTTGIKIIWLWKWVCYCFFLVCIWSIPFNTYLFLPHSLKFIQRIQNVDSQSRKQWVHSTQFSLIANE